MYPLAESDLEHILEHTTNLWNEIRGCRVFITGGTGFFGRWLLESLLRADERLELGISVSVLTRNPQAFSEATPHIAGHRSLQAVQGDVRSFEYPSGQFDFVIHAATCASLTQSQNAPMEMLGTMFDGTRRVLEFALDRGVRRLLLTSSGAVYGTQPPELTNVPEDFRGAPNQLSSMSVYGEGKRLSELMCGFYSQGTGLECAIARCFTFVGPGLPLDTHFAIGNFIRDAIAGGPIRIGGDGRPLRSYLYAADLAIWLWTILFRGRPMQPYNVGSEDSFSIAELADCVRNALNPKAEILISGQADEATAAPRYLPSTNLARTELGLNASVPLDDAIRRTARSHGWLEGKPI